MGFPLSSAGKESACNTGDLGSILESGRSPGKGNGNPLQCSCLENPRDGEPGGLPSMGSHRVGHDQSDLAAAAAPILWPHDAKSQLTGKDSDAGKY